MFERFTKEARAVVKDAEAQARMLGSPSVEAEHLLLALTREDAETTAAGTALAAVELDYDAAREALDAERERSLLAVGITAGEFDVPIAPRAGRPRMGASAKTALERALRVSLVRADRRINAGHVLLALLQAEAGTVPRALAEAGVDRDDLRARTAAAMDRD
jgi:ATP-dependent Clp protease ATP-binding subunit ClpA